jgi:hypothetical protein
MPSSPWLLGYGRIKTPLNEFGLEYGRKISVPMSPSRGEWRHKWLRLASDQEGRNLHRSIVRCSRTRNLRCRGARLLCIRAAAPLRLRSPPPADRCGAASSSSAARAGLVKAGRGRTDDDVFVSGIFVISVGVCAGWPAHSSAASLSSTTTRTSALDGWT